MNKLLTIPLIILSIFGIIFISLLVHEGVHVMQSKSPQSICYDMQQATWMTVYHTPEDFEDFPKYQDFATYSEKWARIMELASLIGLSISIGFVICLISWNEWNNKR